MSVKPYLFVTGTLFDLVVLVHIWRLLVEGHGIGDALWIVAATTIVAAGLSVWAWILFARMARAKGTQQ